MSFNLAFAALLFLPHLSALEPQGSPSLSPSEILAREGPSVVVIERRDQHGTAIGQASGVIIRTDGIVVTNFHVLKGACDLRVETVQGERFPVASVVAMQETSDIALLRISAKNLPVATIGDSSALRTGARVVAIGNPRGLENSLSEGLISGIRRIGSDDLLQITAPISPGSSGGGLYDAKGRLVGITTFTLRESQNLNFAVPVASITKLLKQTAGAEVAWSVAAAGLCSDTSAKLDAVQIVGVLGRSLFEDSVRSLLTELNGGQEPQPSWRNVTEIGELRNYLFRRVGILIDFLDGVAYTVELHGRDPGGIFRGTLPFRGTFPLGLSWGMSQNEVGRLLGPPKYPPMTMPPAWGLCNTLESFRIGKYSYSLGYSESGHLVYIDVRLNTK
jgi:hypothetical protein